MKAYDNPSCVTIDDFNRDLNHYITIKKTARKYESDRSLLRKLVNQHVIYYNMFGTVATDLLLYKVTEPDILQHIIPIILYLGRSTSALDTINITLNTDTIRQLNDL